MDSKSRGNLIKWLLIALTPISVGVGVIYQDAISQAAKDSGITGGFVKMLGALASSYWGLGFLAISIMILGAIFCLLGISLWERLTSKEKMVEAAIMIVADNANEPHEYRGVSGTTFNVKRHHITNPACQTFFVEYIDPIKSPVVQIYSESEIEWCEWDFTERYLFLHFSKLPPNSYFIVLIMEEERTSLRRQGSQVPTRSIELKREFALEFLEEYQGSEQPSRTKKLKFWKKNETPDRLT